MTNNGNRLFVQQKVNEVMSSQKIDGIVLKKMMVAAAQNLEHTKEEINAINVFPIPDGANTPRNSPSPTVRLASSNTTILEPLL